MKSNELSILMNLKLHETYKAENHIVMRVMGGWIYTDRRNDQAPSGVFVAIAPDQTLDSKDVTVE